jgi:hypothetical protein
MRRCEHRLTCQHDGQPDSSTTGTWKQLLLERRNCPGHYNCWILAPGFWLVDFRPLILLLRVTLVEAFRIFLYPGVPDRALYALRLPPVARVRLPP